MHALIRVRARFGNSLDHREGSAKKQRLIPVLKLHPTQSRLEVKTLNAKKQHQPSH